jgi:3-oxoacyl-[acyl-carrier-protein] synthase-3
LSISKRGAIVSVGTAVPDSIVTNQEFAKYLDTSDEWISSRTGIKKRHLFPRGTCAFAWELGGTAAQRAMQRAGVEPSEVDAIICATFTPDYFFPSTACKMQAFLKCDNAFAFDISAACAGFVYGLATANSMIMSGQCSTVVLVGAEIISKTLNWEDRTTCILFGDAAGAVVIKATEKPGRGVLSTYLISDGTLGDILKIPAWGERRVMEMNGNEVYKHAVRMMQEGTLKALQRAQIGLESVDLIIPHQANNRITKALAQHLGIPFEKVVSNIESYGNTSSASIPLALEEVWDRGRIGDGTTVVFTSLGGGIASGSAVVRF